MSDEKNKKKKVRLSTIFLYAIIVVILVYLIIPFGMNLRREINIKKDMESVYTDAEFVAIKCDSKPFDKEELKGQFLWFGEGVPEDDLYGFLIRDSEDNTAIGYATTDGSVVFDHYGAIYYAEEMIEYFKETVDFEHNFPELGYYIPKTNVINDCRLVLTHDCTTFEGFRKAGTIGYFYLGSGGYPGLLVGLEDTSKETRNAINQILAEADFDIYVKYSSMNSEYSDERCLYTGDTCGSYYPFDASYEEAVLGK